MATDNIARGLSKRNEKVLNVKSQEIIDKAVDVKLNTIETDRVANSLGQSEEGFINVENVKGKTLQNLIDVSLIAGEANGTQYMYDYLSKTLTNKSPVDNMAWVDKKSLGSVKPRTQYTLICNVLQDNTSFDIKSRNNEAVFLIGNVNKGLFIKKLTTNENQTEFMLKIADSKKENIVSISHVMLLEGDWTNKEIPNYFEGIKSVGEEHTVVNYMKKGFSDVSMWSNPQFTYTGDGYAKTISGGIGQFMAIKKDMISVKPDTIYTFVMDVKRNTMKSTFRIAGMDAQSKFPITPLFEGGFTGITKKVIRSYSDFSKLQQGTDLHLGANAVEDGQAEFRMMILEGDWTNKEVPAYFEGTKSVGEEHVRLQVRSTGKNLLNLRDLNSTEYGVKITIENQTVNLHGSISPNAWLWLVVTKEKSYFCKGDPNADTNMPMLLEAINKKTLSNGISKASHKVLSGTLPDSFGVRAFDLNGNRMSVTNNIIEGTIGAVSFYLGSAYTYDNCKLVLQLERGTTATEYNPYNENTLNFPLSEPLRSLPNGVCDEIIGDKLIRRVGKVVLNGSENWSKDNDVNNANDYFYISPSDYRFVRELVSSVENNAIITTHFTKGNSNVVGFWNTNVFCLTVEKSKTGITSTDDKDTRKQKMKNWLQSNNVTVYYQLSTPIETTISLPSLKSFKNGSIYLQNSITPNVAIKYPTNLAGRVFMAEQEYSRASTSVNNYWQTLLILADRELRMKSIQPLTTNTTADIKNKLNEIMNAWK